MKSYWKYIPFVIAAALVCILIFHHSDKPLPSDPGVIIHQERASEHEKQAQAADQSAQVHEHRLDSAKTVRRQIIKNHVEIKNLDYLRALALHDSLMRAAGLR